MSAHKIQYPPLTWNGQVFVSITNYSTPNQTNNPPQSCALGITEISLPCGPTKKGIIRINGILEACGFIYGSYLFVINLWGVNFWIRRLTSL